MADATVWDLAQELIRCVTRALYSDLHFAVVEALLQTLKSENDRVEEKELIDKLHIDKKGFRSGIGRLRADKILHGVDKTPESKNELDFDIGKTIKGRELKKTYKKQEILFMYYIDPAQLVKVLKFRLTKVGKDVFFCVFSIFADAYFTPLSMLLLPDLG